MILSSHSLRQFTEQDVMVPWHLQPRYSSQCGREGAKKKMNKKQRAMRRKGRVRDDGVMEGSDGGGEGCEVGRREEGGEGGQAPAALCHCENIQSSQQEGVATKSDSSPAPLSTDDELTASCDVKSNSGYREPLQYGHTTGHVTTKSDHMTNLEVQGYQTFHRYYHVFQKNELSALFNEVGRVRVIEEFYDHENWCVVAEKIT